MKDNLHPSHLSRTIWVFRTSVKMHVDIRRLKPILDRLMEEGDKWNFDLEDCDHILRVETKSLIATEIISQMEKAGYQCAELEDKENTHATETCWSKLQQGLTTYN